MLQMIDMYAVRQNVQERIWTQYKWNFHNVVSLVFTKFFTIEGCVCARAMKSFDWICQLWRKNLPFF